MKKSIFSYLLCFWAVAGFAQEDENAIKATIQQLFDGMRLKDSSMVRDSFDASVRLQTTGFRDGKAFLRTESVADFLKIVATPRPEIFEEKVQAYQIQIDLPMASVWTPYQFFVDKKFSHCGINAFQLFKSEKGWKIIQIVDTRRKEKCE